MDPKVIIAIVVAVIVILAIAYFISSRKHRTEHLRQQFGPEYDRAVTQHPLRDGSCGGVRSRAEYDEIINAAPGDDGRAQGVHRRGDLQRLRIGQHARCRR